MAEENVNINNEELTNSNLDLKDSDPVVNPTSTQEPINPLLNLPNDAIVNNQPVINSADLPTATREVKDFTLPNLDVPSTTDYAYPQLTQSSLQDAISEMETDGYFQNAYGAGQITPATLQAIQEVEAPINQYLYSDYANTSSPRPSRGYLDDDPYGQMTGDYDYDSDLGLAQGFENALYQSILDTPKEKAPGLKPPVVFGARAYNLDRYMAHPKFSDLGFHPFRDNEEYYNDGRTTRFQNGRRTFNAYWDMFFSAAGGNYRSAKDVAGGDFLGSDMIGAQSMEDAMRIASSTRGGLGGWINDFMLNSAYTFGTIASIVAEEAALAAALYGTKSPAVAKTAAVRTGVNLRRLMKSLPAMFDMRKAAAASQKILNQMKNINLAKDWRKAAMLTGTGAINGFKRVGGFLAPQTSLAMKRWATAANTGENISSLARGADHVAAFYRDLRMINLALAEGKMEGGMVEMRVREDLYNAFEEKYGVAPTEDQMNFINNQAVTAAANTTLFNTPVIFASNAIVLRNMFGGFRPLNELLEETAQGAGRRIYRNPNFKPGKKVLNKEGKEIGEDAWFYSDSFFGHMNQLRKMGFKKGWGKHLGAAALRYTGANWMEGFQEVYQEAVAAGMEQYYAGMYEDPIATGLDITAAGILEPQIGGKAAIRDAAMKGISSQMSGQGASVFMSGFLMGGLLGPTTKFLFQGIPNGFKYITDREAYKQYQADKKKYIQDVVKTLNDIYADPEFYTNPTKLNAIIQKQLSHRMATSTIANDTQELQDARHQSMYNDIYTAITLGKFRDMREYFQDFAKMSDEDLKGAFPDSKKSPEKIRQGFEKGIKKLEEVKEQYDKFDAKYRNPFDPSKYKKGTRVYQEEVIRQNAYHQAKMLLLFQKDAMKDATIRMNQIQNELISGNGALANVKHNDIFVLTSRKRMTSEIDRLSKLIKFTKADTPELKAQKEGYKKRLKHLEDIYKVLFDPKNQVRSAGAMKDFVLQDENGKPILGEDGNPIKIKDPNSPTGFRQIPENQRDFILGGYNKRPAYMAKLKVPVLAYLRFLAEQNNETLENDNIDDTLKKLVDYGHLGSRVGDYYMATEILSDPNTLLMTSYKIAEVMNKQYNRYKNSHYRRVKQFVSTQERHEFLKDLARIGVYPDPEQVKNFLSKKQEDLTIDDIPDMFYTEEGLITMEEDPAMFAEVKQIVKKMELIIEPEQKPKKEDTQKEETDPEKQVVNVNPINTETPEEEKEVKETLVKLDEFKKNDKGTKIILDREWEKVRQQKFRETGEFPTESDKKQWLADGSKQGGLRYLDARWRAFKLYESSPMEEKLGPDKKLLSFDEWLEQNIRDNRIARDISSKLGLGVYDILPRIVTDQKTKLNNLEIDGAKIIKAFPNLNMYIVEVPGRLNEDGPDAIKNYQLVDIDNNFITRKYSAIRMQHPDLNWRASYPNAAEAISAAKDIAKVLPSSEVFNFDNQEYKTGDIVVDTNGNRWYIASNIAQVDSDGYITIKAVDSKKSNNNKLFSKILPGDWVNKKWKKENIKEDRWDFNLIEGNVSKLSRTEPLNFFTNPNYNKKMLTKKQLQKMLNKISAKDKAKLKIQVSLNPAYASDSKLKIEERVNAFARSTNQTDIKTNKLLKKAEPKYIIRMVMPDGSFIQLQGIDTKFVDPNNEKVEINPLSMSRDQYLKYFYPPKPTTNQSLDQAYLDTLRSYAATQLIYQALGDAMTLLKPTDSQITLDLFDKEKLAKQIKDQNVLKNLNKIQGILRPGGMDWYKPNGEKYETPFDKLEQKYITEINGEGKYYIIDNNKGTVIHNFDLTVPEEKAALTEFQQSFQKSKYKNALDNLGRYVLVIQQANGVISLAELKASELVYEDQESILADLIALQQKTNKSQKEGGNIKYVKGKKTAVDPSFNFRENDNLNSRFYISGKSGDILNINVGPLGGIIVKYTRDKGLDTERTDIVSITEEQLKENKITYFSDFLSLVNSKWSEKQQKKQEQDKDYEPLQLIDEKGLTTDKFRAGIPMYADETIVDKTVAKISPDLRKPSLGLNWSDIEGLDLLIQQAQEINEPSNVDQSDNQRQGVEQDTVLIDAAYVDKYTDKWQTVPKRDLELLAAKGGANPADNLTDLEKIVYDNTGIAKKIKDGEIVITEQFNINNDTTTQTEGDALQIEDKIQRKTSEINNYKRNKSQQIADDIQKKSTYTDVNGTSINLDGMDQASKSLLMVNELNAFEQRGDATLNNLQAELNELKKEAKRVAKDDPQFSVVDPKQLDEKQVEDIDKFISFIKRVFPPGVITVSDINDLKASLKNNGVTLGAFVMSLEQLAGGIKQYQGKIYTSETSPDKYHEAFHAVFRLLLPDAQITELLNIARRDVRKELRQQGTSLKEALVKFQLKSPIYAQLKGKELEERFYEEWLADKFEDFKMNPGATKVPSVAKSFFQKIIDFIVELFTRADRNQLVNIFEDIDAGKFSTTPGVNSNTFTRRLDQKLARGEGVAFDQGVSVSDDITFSIQLKTGEVALYENYYDDQKQGWKKRLVDKDVYMNAADVNTLINNIGALYLDRFMRVKGEFFPPAMIRATVTDYIEMYNPRRKFYADDPNVANYVVKLNTKYNSLLQNQSEIEDGVTKYLELFDMKINMEDLDINADYQNEYDNLFDQNGIPKEGNWEAEPQGIGGFRSLSKALRIFIATTTLPDTDSFQNPNEIPTNIYINDDMQERHMVSVNYVDAYNGLLRAVKNSKSEMEMLQKMVMFKDTSTHAAAVIDKFFRKMGIADPQALLQEEADFPIAEVEATDPVFFNQVIKGLNQYVVDYLFIEKSGKGSDTQQGTISIYEANTKDDAHEQIKRWQNVYLTKAQNLRDPLNSKDRIEAATVINEFKSYLSTTRKAINDNDTYSNGEVSKIGVDTISKNLSLDIFKHTGIKLSAGYIRFSIINNINENLIRTGSNKKLSNKQRLILASNETSEPITLADLENFEGSISKGEDLFARINNDTAEQITAKEDIPLNRAQRKVVKPENVGIEARLKKFARGNALFDETVGTTVFRDPEGNLIYSHQMPTFHLEKVAELNSEEKINGLLEDGYLSKNALLNDPRFLALSRSGNLRVLRLSGSKESAVKKDEVSGKFYGSGKGAGVTYGDSTPSDFISSLINLYLHDYNPINGKVSKRTYIDENNDVQDFVTAPSLLRVIEAANTGDFVALPVRKTVEYNASDKTSKITDETLEYFIEELRTSYDTIRQNVAELNNPSDASRTSTVYNGYNDIISLDEIQDYELKEDGTKDLTKPIEDKQRGFKLGSAGRYIIVDKQLEDGTIEKNRSVHDKLQDLARQGDVSFDNAIKQVFKNTDVLKTAIERRLEADFTEFNDILFDLGVLNIAEKGGAIEVSMISTGFQSGLVDVNGQSTEDVKASMVALNLESNLNHNLKQVFLNDLMNTRSINQVLLGNQAISLKNAIDAIKRAKGQNGAGPSVKSIIGWKKYGINAFSELDGFFHDDPTHLSEFTVGTNREEIDSNDTQDSMDAMVHITLNGFKHTEFGIGQLNESQADMIQTMEGEGAAVNYRGGRDSTNNEWFGDPNFNTRGQKDRDAAINSRKYVYFDGKTMGKMSVVTLIPSYTSLRNPDTGEYDRPRPGHEKLHNLRIKLEAHEAKTGRIAMSFPKSASKMMNMFLANAETAFDSTPITSENGTQNWRPRVLDASMLRLQQVTPSGKTVVVDPRQIKMLITSEQNLNAEVTIPWLNGGKPTRIGDVISEYDKLVGGRMARKFADKRNLLFEFKEKFGKQTYASMLLRKVEKLKAEDINVDMTTFLKYAVAGLEAGKTKDQLTAFFKPDANGKARNLNNPLTFKQFQTLYFSYWKDVLGERQPGVSLTLRSSVGTKQLKRAGKIDKETGQPIPGLASVITYAEQDQMQKNGELSAILNNMTDDQKQYVDKTGNQEFLQENGRVNPIYDSRDQLFRKGSIKEGDYYYDDLRYDIDEYKDGKKTGQTYSEFMMPPHFQSILENWKPGTPIPDAIAKAFGIRIPTQDKHSAINLKVVNFMPLVLGSQGIFPRQLIEVSGADFDIDTLYTQIKEHFVQKRVIKTAEQIEAEFQEWASTESYSPEVEKATNGERTTLNRKETFGENFDENRARAEFAAIEENNYPIKVRKKQVVTEATVDKSKSLSDLKDMIDRKETQVEVQFKDLTEGTIKEYGDARTIEEEYSQYLRYMLKEASTPGSAMSLSIDKFLDKNLQYLKGDGTISKEEFRKQQFDFVKQQRDLLSLVNQNSLISEINDLYSVSKVLNAALEQLKLPTTLKEYKEWKTDQNGNDNVGGNTPFSAPYSNKLLDVKFAMLGNDGMKDIKNEPAVTTPLEEYLSDIEKELPEFYELIKEAGVDVDSLFGKTVSFKANKEGARNIGGVVVKNSAVSFLSQHNVSLRVVKKPDGEVVVDHRIVFNDQTFSEFNQNLTTKGVRTQYVISALITAMTDNAKLRLADKLGLNRNALGVVTSMIALGMDTRTALDTVNQPLVKEIYKDVAAGTPLSIALGEYIMDMSLAIQEKKENLASRTSPEAADKAVKELMINLKTKGLSPESLRKNLEVFSKADKKINSPIQPEFLETLTLDETVNAYGGLILFSKGYNVSKYVGNMASLTTLLEGFGRDLTDLEDRDISFGKLGLLDALDKSAPFDIRHLILNKKDFDEAKLQYGSIQKQKETILSHYYYANKEFKQLLPKVFLAYTAPFNLINRHILRNYTNSSFVMDGAELQKINTETISYLMLKAYQHQLSNDVRIAGSLSNGIMYDQVEGKELTKYVKELKDILEKKNKRNNFIDDFLYVMDTKNSENKKGYVRGISNTWITVGEMQQIFNQNSFLELFSDDDTRHYAYDLMHYLLVKDGMQWQVDTFIDSIPVQIFDGPLAAVNKVHEVFAEINSYEDLQNADDKIKSIFGVDFKTLVTDMESSFIASKGNYRLVKLKKPKTKNIKAPTAIKDNRMVINLLAGVAPLQEYTDLEGEVVRKVKSDQKISTDILEETGEIAEKFKANISYISNMGLKYNPAKVVEKSGARSVVKEYPMYDFPIIVKRSIKSYNPQFGRSTYKEKIYYLEKVYNPFLESNSNDLYDLASSDVNVSTTRGVRADYVELQSGLLGTPDQFVHGHMFGPQVPEKDLRTNKKSVSSSTPNNEMSEAERKSYEESLKKQVEEMDARERSQYNPDSMQKINITDGGPNNTDVNVTNSEGKTDNPANMTLEQKGFRQEGTKEEEYIPEAEEADRLANEKLGEQAEEKGGGVINVFDAFKDNESTTISNELNETKKGKVDYWTKGARVIAEWWDTLTEKQKIKVVEKGNFKSGHQSFFKFYDEVYNDLKGGPLEGLNTKQSGEAVVKQLTCLL